MQYTICTYLTSVHGIMRGIFPELFNGVSKNIIRFEYASHLKTDYIFANSIESTTISLSSLFRENPSHCKLMFNGFACSGGVEKKDMEIPKNTKKTIRRA